eukprot:1189135-Pleurochrysis_carterae.AAC.1
MVNCDRCTTSRAAFMSVLYSHCCVRFAIEKCDRCATSIRAAFIAKQFSLCHCCIRLAIVKCDRCTTFVDVFIAIRISCCGVRFAM